MDTITEKNNKVPVGTNLDPAIYAAVSKMAIDEDRSISNMVERLLKESPRVEASILESEPAAAGAGN